MRFLIFCAAGGLLIAQDQGLVADTIWNSFRAVNWQQSMNGWQSRHPNVKCRSGHGSGGLTDAAEDYCHECPADNAGVTSSSFFYAFDPQQPVCALLQFRISSPPELPQGAAQTYDDLRARLDHEYGPGQDPGKVDGFGSAFWRNVWLWRSPEAEALLFVNEGRGTAKVELLARHRKLLDAKAQDSRIAFLRFEYFEDRERQFYASLADVLKAELPNLPALAAETDWQRLDQDTVVADLRTLVFSAGSGAPALRAARLLMADRLASMLAVSWKPPYSGRQLQVGDFVLSYVFDHLADGWVYDHVLQRRVAQVYPETDAGQWAFLSLENRGGYAGAGCPSDPALFHTVIAQVEPYLKQRPNALYRESLLFDLAQAYETWWSASQAPATDDYVVASTYKSGAENARNSAIELYEQISRAAPESDFGIVAARLLPRLRLNVDTGQRRYYCIYD